MDFCFIWILDAQVLNKNDVGEYVSFVDKIVHIFLPNKNEKLDFYELVKLYQLQRHSKHAPIINTMVIDFTLENSFQNLT